MARPIKIGLDYFPLDVRNDDKLDLIEAEFGLTGFAIVIKLYSKIYENGYFYEWGEDQLLLYKKRVNVEKGLINNVIKACFSRNIFDKKKFDNYKILTSKGIQKRFIQAVKSNRRKKVVLEEQYLCEGINDFINEINSEFIVINSDINTQSKVKENKVKETKVSFEKFWILYDKKVGKIEKVKSNWDKLSLETQKEIQNYIPKYIESQPNKKFRKDPNTFLNNESWKDEIIGKQKPKRFGDSANENFKF